MLIQFDRNSNNDVITAQCMRKKTTVKRKLSDVPNLLESLCKIVQFIYNIGSYITLCRRRCRGRDGKSQPNFSWEDVGVLLGKQRQIFNFQGWDFPIYFPERFLIFLADRTTCNSSAYVTVRTCCVRLSPSGVRDITYCG